MDRGVGLLLVQPAVHVDEAVLRVGAEQGPAAPSTTKRSPTFATAGVTENQRVTLKASRRLPSQSQPMRPLVRCRIGFAASAYSIGTCDG